MPKNILLTALTLIIFLTSNAQTKGTLKGVLQDTVNKQTLKSATISILEPKDSTLEVFGLTNDAGAFTIYNVGIGNHLLLISFQGYAVKYIPFEISANAMQKNIGNIYLEPTVKDLGNVTVTQSPVVVKGDTVEYNASSFKTKPNGTVEDVLKKLPGVEVAKDGSIKAQGETVQRVLVDGKRFFGDDPTLATKNLPNDVVDKIQVYDAQSDQSAFTGFDDGNKTKTINITTKKDKRKGYFGKISAGAGDDGRFENSLNFNRFNGKQQLSVIGQYNNVNRQGFSLQDILGVMNMGGGNAMMGGGNRGGGGGNMSSSFIQNLIGGSNNNGIRTIGAGGLNYRDTWGKKTDAYGSYFYNNSRIDKNQDNFTENILVGDSSLFQTSNQLSRNKNQNHRFNFNIETQFDTANSLIIRPNITYQNSDNFSQSTSTTFKGVSKFLNGANTVTNSNGQGYNGNVDATIRHKFARRGRTISLNTVFGGSQNDRTTFSNTIINRTGATDSINQMAINNTNGKNITATIAYTEPVGKNKLIELAYTLAYNLNESDRRTYNYNKNSKGYDDLNVQLSNIFENTNTSNRVGISYRIQEKKYTAGIGIGVQMATLNSFNKTKDSTLSQAFNNLFPNANFTYNFTKSKTLRFNYRGRTNQPSVTQLQPVIDNSNPLNVSQGNPALKQEFTHNFNIAYTKFNMFTFRNFFAGLNGSVTGNKIVNSIQYTPVGGQITKPVNLNGAYNIIGFANIGIPVKKLKGNASFTTNINYIRDVSLVNNNKNYTNNIGIGQTLSFNTNIKDKLDLNFSSTTNYNIARYTLQPEQNNNFFSEILGVDATIILKKGWLWAHEFDYTINRGRTAGFNQNIPIWNMSVSKQLFKKKEGELKVGIYDLLNQNKSITRNITDNTVQDVRTTVIQRYFLISFTYNLRKFAGASAQMPSFMNGMFRRMQRSGGSIGGPM